MDGTWLTGVTLADGSPADVHLLDGKVHEVDRVRSGAHGLDLTGHLLLPAPAEPHAHLDKALLLDRMTNPAGDLSGAIEAIVAGAARPATRTSWNGPPRRHCCWSATAPP